MGRLVEAAQQTSGLLSLAGGQQYHGVGGVSGALVQGLEAATLQMVPEMSTSSSINSQTVSFVFNQLGASSINEPTTVNSVINTAISSHSNQQEQTQESLSDATIQGLINSTQNFTVPVLSPDMPPLTGRNSQPAVVPCSTVENTSYSDVSSSIAHLSSVVSRTRYSEPTITASSLSNIVSSEQEMLTATPGVNRVTTTSVVLNLGGEPLPINVTTT